MEISKKYTDVILWEELKKGSVVALGGLYDLYIDTLFSYGLKISNDKEYLMDCIHDVFLDLYKYRAKLKSTEKVKFYLLTCLKRKLNKRYRSKMVLLSNENAIEEINIPDNYSKPYEEVIIDMEIASEITGKLRHAINFLTKTQKKGLFLRFNKNKPYEEIAEIMDVSVETSRTIVYRGIKLLRQHLATVIVFISSVF